jgi:hypothetical protein
MRRTNALVVVLLATGLTSSLLNAQTEKGVVTTFAGSPGAAAYVNGTGSQAMFVSPKGMSIDFLDNVFTVDAYCGTIRKITPNGVVSTLAGPTPDVGCAFGSADGLGRNARFNSPSGTAVDSLGNVYVADSGNCTLRKIDLLGVVTTVAGSPGVCVAVDGAKSVARFNALAGVVVDSLNNIYVTSAYDCTVRQVTFDGTVTTVAGVAGTCQEQDGTGTGALFNVPSGIGIDLLDNVYVTDIAGCTIRKITRKGVVTTFAGQAGVCGSADGKGSSALFNGPSYIAVDKIGRMFVTDFGNDTIRQISPTGVVITLAGVSGTAGSTDGTGTGALFDNPDGVVADNLLNIYVADRGNSTIRYIKVPLLP